MKQAGVHDPIQYVRTERATRDAIDEALNRRGRRRQVAVEHRDQGDVVVLRIKFCGWCGRRLPCAAHADLEAAWWEEHGEEASAPNGGMSAASG